jgi:hypothetical protein
MYQAPHNSLPSEPETTAFAFVDSGFAKLLWAGALYFAIQYAVSFAA